MNINSIDDFKEFMKTIFNSETSRNNDRYKNDVDAVKIRIKQINNTNCKVLVEILETAIKH